MLRKVVVLGVLAPGLSGCGDGGNSDSASGCPDAPGIVCTWAGSGEVGYNGDGLALTGSDLYWPSAIAFAADDTAYIADWQNHMIRRSTPAGTLELVVGSESGFPGDGPEDLEEFTDLEPPGAPGKKVLLNHPTGLVAQPDGTLLIVAWHNHKIRHFNPTTDLVLVECGRGAGFTGDGGPASAGLLNQPSQLVLATDGAQFVLDQRNQVIRKIDVDGNLKTVAGTPTKPGFSGDGGAPLSAQFSFPAGPNPDPAGGLALDAAGNLYVADTLNHRIRKIDFDADEISTLAGTGEPAFSGDRGPATEAALNGPRTLAIGPDARLYVADEYNHRIRAIDLETGIIETVAGNGDAAFSGDGGPASEASLNRPGGLAFDSKGALYIVDSYNSRIRRVGAKD